jgi:hypothetical protein
MRSARIVLSELIGFRVPRRRARSCTRTPPE